MAQTSSPRRPYAARLPAEQRREQLLDAALRVIARDGYEAVSIEAIAQQAGVTRPVVYGSFENLAVLLGALFERQKTRALAQLAELLPADPGEIDPDELYVEGVRGFLTRVAADPDTWRLILLGPESTPSAVRKQVRRSRESLVVMVEQLVGWGVARRGGPVGLDDIELAARSIVTLCEDAARLVLTDPDRYPPERIARFAAVVLAALPSQAGQK